MEPNNKWKKLFFVSFIFNLVVIFSFVVFSFIVPAKKKNVSRAYSAFQAQLTPEQRAALDQLQQEYKVKIDSLWKEVRKNRVKFWKALLDTPTDSTKINQLIREIINDEVKVKEQAYRHILRQMKVLTPEQRRKRLANLIEKPLRRNKSKSGTKKSSAKD